MASLDSVRIVSLVPSLTHALCDLGLRSNIVGCTSFCVKPADLYRTAKNIGGTKDADIQKIKDLRPTHIIANAEENPESIRLDCQSIAPTLVTFPKAPHEVPAMLHNLGEFLGAKESAGEAATQCLEALGDLSELVAERMQQGYWERKKFLYFIWRDPWMVVAKDTYINAMLELLGYENVAPNHTRYPALAVSEIARCSADVALLSSEPWPFRNRDRDALVQELSLGGHAIPEFVKIDGQLLSWYGTMTTTALHRMSEWVLSGQFN